VVIPVDQSLAVRANSLAVKANGGRQ
jgi:hypothetical protein